ncbi:MAG: DnaA regulatory inactivator Hda [Gammaproteobacteria bacterium]|nr:DnaA regulatory inactivator Hda [Gammaproteobacteria bacterium]MDH5803315.1 DnaA regulatory inactivator Hda [Gammaproteobacteria bacterium]
MSSQLPLHIGINDNASFDSFFGGRNAEVVSHIQSLAQHRDEPFVYLSGGNALGKSHLLQAASRLAARGGRSVAYLPMSQVAQFDTAMLEGLDQAALVCVDDVHRIVGQPRWEEALFHLYNNLRQSQVPLLVSANAKPEDLGLGLMDLQSRLSWGLILQIKPLDEAEKIQVLQLRAKLRGLLLSPDVAGFILRRCPRDMDSLMRILEHIDQASLAAKRKLTVPFVKSLLDESLSQLLRSHSQTPA